MKRSLFLGLSLLAASALATAATPSQGRSLQGPGIPQGAGIMTPDVGENHSVSEMGQVLTTPRSGFSAGIRQRPAGIAGEARRPASYKSLSGAQFHTWMSGSETDAPGWYSFDTDGTYKLQWTNIYSDYNINLTNGWMRNGNLCGLGVMNMGGMIIYYNYVEFNPKTGQMIKEEGLAPDNMIDMATYYISCAYVAEEDRIYGYTYNEDMTEYYFTSSPASNPGKVTKIKQLAAAGDRPIALCYNPEEKALYGVTFNTSFVKISLEGEMTKIFDLPLDNVKNEKTALTYSPYDGCFIYTPSYYYYATQLYYVYPEEKQIRFVRNFPGAEQFYFFLNENYKFDGAAPARPTLVSDDMTPGALEGKWTLKMPALTADGDPLSGNLIWTLYVDNAATNNGMAAPGSDVEISVGPLEQGEHVIRVSCKASGGEEGLPYVVDRWFGNGIPMQPAEVTMTRGTVSWTPVDEAVLGGYLDLSKMRYEVYVNDRFIGSTQDTSMEIELDPEVPVTAYYAYVAASCNNQVSDRTKSNKVIFGAPLPLPYTVVPTAEQADLCEVFNVDGSPDYGTWEFWETRWHEPVFASGWSRSPADDWLILPPVDCPDLSHAYRVTLDAICGGLTGKDERFEVWCGNEADPEAMNTLIIPETQVTEFITEGWETFTNLFVPKQAGKTFVAIRAVSPADQHSLIVRKITIEATDEPADVPEAPSNFTVTGKNDAELTANISLTIPTKTIAGSEIAADGDLKLKVGVGEQWVEREVNPGEKVEMTIDTYQGDNRLVAYCVLNGQNGQEASANIFTGTIPPNFVENLTHEVSRDNMSVTLKWEPPVCGQENLEGYYSPEGMHYWLKELVVDPEYGDTEWVATRNLGDVNELTYELPEGAPLQVKYLGISAANAGGISDAIWYVYPEIGTPYKPEINETFTKGNEPAVNYRPLQFLAVNEEYTTEWDLIYPEELGADLWDPEIPYAMINYATSDESVSRGWLQLPKMSSEVDNPGLTLLLWTSAPCDGEVTVCAKTFGVDWKKIYDVPQLNKGWQSIVIPMPEEFRDKPWIQLALDTYLPGYYSYVLLGGYKFGYFDPSGTTEISAPGNAIFGGKGEVVVLGHEGEEITVCAMDGRVIASVRSASAEEILPATPGIYTVVCGESSAKVIVR